MDLVVHGIYDAQTLQTLINKSHLSFGFDLRARSSNLVPFVTLLELLNSMDHSRFFITFENDRLTTILSFLDLLKEHRSKAILEFRDAFPADFYASVKHPFIWFFNPQADWKGILLLENIKGIVLPTKFKSIYANLDFLWETAQRRNLEVFLHAENFQELEEYLDLKNLKLSVDINSEVEKSYRRVDQEKLNNLRIWSPRNESFIGQ